MFIPGAVEDATPQTANGAFPYLIPLPCLRLPSSVVDAVNLGRDNELFAISSGRRLPPYSKPRSVAIPMAQPSTPENLGAFYCSGAHSISGAAALSAFPCRLNRNIIIDRPLPALNCAPP